jgi:hypothetical protein
MKLVKSLLLGSVVGLTTVAGAQAADLPSKKAAAVEYVKVCNTYGAGFFYIPGTDTCLRVSGRVRADYIYRETFSRASDATGFRTRGRIQLDARTSTAYGLLRSVVRFEITRDSGTPLSNTGAIGTTSNVAQAFVQFGGLTAGRVTTMFDNGDLPTGHFGTLRFSDAPDVDLLAYTYSFGNGFSATLSVEDGIERRNAGFPTNGFEDSRFVYAGQRMPDVVANIKYAGTWGSAQLSGALHQLRALNTYTNSLGYTDYPDTEYGFAVQANVGINLPMLAPGDAMWLNAVYADGALGYITGGSSTGFGAGNAAGVLADAFVNPITGNVDRGRGWSVAGGLRHYWTPEIRSNLFGSYARFEYGSAAGLVPADASVLRDFNEYRIGTNLIWQPVSGLDLGVEVIYANVDVRGYGLIGSVGRDHVWEGRLRVQRDF